jgi:hypothetical protein
MVGMLLRSISTQRKYAGLRGFCQNAGHFMNKVPLTVMKSLGGYDPAKVIRKKDHGNRLLNTSLGV